MPLPAWICETCGSQLEPSTSAPATCLICEDERQYVGWNGQRWTTQEQLARDHAIHFDVEAGVRTLAVTPAFAIGQRAFLLPDRGHNVLWECLPLVTEAAVAELRAAGGVSAIAISHPHFYSAMVDWSEALEAPVYLHEADRAWVQRNSPNLRFWSGEQLRLSEELVLVRLAGHFPGSTGLWWSNGPRRGGSLFPGDALQVTMDRRHATFMYSYPNAIPLSAESVLGLERAVAPLAFEDLFGFSPGRQIIGEAKRALERSFARYLGAIGRHAAAPSRAAP